MRHRTDVTSLLFGVLFLGLALVPSLHDPGKALRWAPVAILLVLGLLGLRSALRPTPPAEPAQDSASPGRTTTV